MAEGRAESMMLAGELAEAILSHDGVQRAAMLRRLVAERSPFALVRAVDLAELMLHADTHKAIDLYEANTKCRR